MRQYPIFLQTQGKTIVIVGGGEAALAKLRLLRKTEATLVVFARNADAQIVADAEAGVLVWHRRDPEPQDFDGVLLVYAATEQAEYDARIAEMGREAGVLVNIVDDLSSDFFSAAIVDRDPVTVAIGTEGTAPVLARQIKAHNEKALSSHLGQVAKLAELFRPRLERWSSTRRRGFWRDFWDGRSLVALQQGGARAVEELLESLYQQHHPRALSTPVMGHRGQISVLGIDTTEPDLLSVRAHHRLDQADWVVFDAGVPWSIQEIARREATHLPLARVTSTLSVLREALQAGHRLVLLQSAHSTPADWQSLKTMLDQENIAVETIGSATWTAKPSIEVSVAPVLLLQHPLPLSQPLHQHEHRAAS